MYTLDCILLELDNYTTKQDHRGTLYKLITGWKYATPSITNWWQWWDVIVQNDVQDTDQMYFKNYFLNHGFGRYFNKTNTENQIHVIFLKICVYKVCPYILKKSPIIACESQTLWLHYINRTKQKQNYILYYNTNN